jgi:hypothetical protein
METVDKENTGNMRCDSQPTPKEPGFYKLPDRVVDVSDERDLGKNDHRILVIEVDQAGEEETKL